MMKQFARCILKLGPLMGDLAVSAAGCFVFTRGFRLVAMDKEGPDAETSVSPADTPHKSLAGIGAGLFLLAFVASEALAAIGALRH